MKMFDCDLNRLFAESIYGFETTVDQKSVIVRQENLSAHVLLPDYCNCVDATVMALIKIYLVEITLLADKSWQVTVQEKENSTVKWGRSDSRLSRAIVMVLLLMREKIPMEAE